MARVTMVLGLMLSTQALAGPMDARGSKSPPKAMEPFRVKSKAGFAKLGKPDADWVRAAKSAQRTKRVHVLEVNGFDVGFHPGESAKKVWNREWQKGLERDRMFRRMQLSPR
jgi:hypothetical protein